jgi:hypothetical protein
MMWRRKRQRGGKGVDWPPSKVQGKGRKGLREGKDETANRRPNVEVERIPDLCSLPLLPHPTHIRSVSLAVATSHCSLCARTDPLPRADPCPSSCHRSPSFPASLAHLSLSLFPFTCSMSNSLEQLKKYTTVVSQPLLPLPRTDG